MSKAIKTADGKMRCIWSSLAPEFISYHDDEWGFPVSDDNRLFEKLCLESFQSGLSWRTILAKRESFRNAFRNFDIDTVARFTQKNIDRLFKDEGIVRHRGKIEAAINNARMAQQLKQEYGSFAAFIWRYETNAPGAHKPQTVELLPESFKYHADIRAIKMRACFSLVLGFERGFPLYFEAAHVSDSNFSWIAVNSHKPMRPDLFILMVHSSEDYAEAHFDDDRAHVMEHLIDETRHIIGHAINTVDYKTIHGGRYANNADKKQKGPIFIDHNLKLAACGDWGLGGRVEGAFNSAYDLMQYMKEKIL